MNTNNIACVLSLLLLSSCGGGFSSDNNKVTDPVVGVNISSSASSSSIDTKVIESLATKELSGSSDIQKLLDSNKQKWALRNIKSYQYKYKVSCFCLDTVTQSKQVTVSDGVVTEAFYLQTSTYLTKEELTTINTVDQLFTIIEQAINQKAYKINVSYNNSYGYPESISIDYSKDIADDEMVYYVSDLM